jgi:hypothetical protein
MGAMDAMDTGDAIEKSEAIDLIDIAEKITRNIRRKLCRRT